MNRTRVLLANGHRLILDALEKLLEPACDVVGKVRDGADLVQAALNLQPDIVIVDLCMSAGMPPAPAIEAATRLRQLACHIELVFLSEQSEPELHGALIRLGASAIVGREAAGSELCARLSRVTAGTGGPSPSCSTTPFRTSETRRRSRRSLTSRQRQVLQLLAEGHTMKQIAAELSIKPRTVAHHKYTMMDSLGIQTSAELIRFAMRQGIVAA